MNPEIESLIEKVKILTTALMKASGFNFKTVEARKDDEKTIRVEMSVDGAGLMIGENGENLYAWEEVLSQWLRRNSSPELEYFRVVLDINNYRWQIEQRLRELAKKTAREVVMSKKSIKLPVMNAYERRIVHVELALHPNVATESEGRVPNRQVVVKPL